MFYENQPHMPQTPAHALLKKTLSSGLFLAIAILYTATIVCSLVTLLLLPMQVSDLMTQLQDILLEADIDISLELFANDVSVLETELLSWYPLILVFSLIGMIPAVLIVVGLWQLYATAKSNNGAPMRPTGFTFLKVSMMIELIVTCVTCAIFVIVLVVLLVAMPALTQGVFGTTEEGEVFAAAMMLVLGIWLVLFAGMFALMIVYYVKALKTIKVVKTTMLTGQPNDKVSIFLVVMLFLSAFSVFSGLMALFTNPISGITTLCTSAVACVTAIALCIYKSKMKALLSAPLQQNGQPLQPGWQQQQGWQQPQQGWQQPQPYTITYTTCEMCGQQYPSGSAVCPKCGAPNRNKS